VAALWGKSCLGKEPPNPAIKLDQVGYLPQIPKVALVTAGTRDTEFTLRRVVDGTIAFSGKLAAAIDDPDSGDKVGAADFSAFRTPGSYYIDVPGVGRSWEFLIAADVYARVFYLAMRSYYSQRPPSSPLPRAPTSPSKRGTQMSACAQRRKPMNGSRRTPPFNSITRLVF
jgi:endoglucanase